MLNCLFVVDRLFVLAPQIVFKCLSMLEGLFIFDCRFVLDIGFHVGFSCKLNFNCDVEKPVPDIYTGCFSYGDFELMWSSHVSVGQLLARTLGRMPRQRYRLAI